MLILNSKNTYIFENVLKIMITLPLISMASEFTNFEELALILVTMFLDVHTDELVIFYY